jgi:hypothetical protein
MVEKDTTNFWEKHETKFKIAGGVAIGVVLGIVLTQNSDAIVKQIQVNVFSHNNSITTELSRRGHPGIIVKDLESGVVAASKNHMAHILGVSKQTLQTMIDNDQVLELGEAI